MRQQRLATPTRPAKRSACPEILGSTPPRHRCFGPTLAMPRNRPQMPAPKELAESQGNQLSRWPLVSHGRLRMVKGRDAKVRRRPPNKQDQGANTPSNPKTTKPSVRMAAPVKLALAPSESQDPRGSTPAAWLESMNLHPPHERHRQYHMAGSGAGAHHGHARKTNPKSTGDAYNQYTFPLK